MYEPIILNDPGDCDSIRIQLSGVDEYFLSDDLLLGPNYIQAVEADLEVIFEEQAKNGVASIETIMARDDKDRDKRFLRMAAINYVVTLAASQITGFIATSVSDGSQSVSYGGVGYTYRDVWTQAQLNVSYFLSRITKFKMSDKVVFAAMGPSKAGVKPDISNGFFSLGRRRR